MRKRDVGTKKMVHLGRSILGKEACLLVDRKKEIAENLSVYLVNMCQDAKNYISTQEVFEDLLVALATIGQLNGMIDKDFQKGLEDCFKMFSSLKLPDAFFHVVDQLEREYRQDD